MRKKSNKQTGAPAVTVQRLVRCQWIRCTKPAKHKIVRANKCVCDEHLEANILQFGCVFETERVNHGI